MREPTVVEVWNDAGLLRERLTELVWRNRAREELNNDDSLVAREVADRISELTGTKAEAVMRMAAREARLLEMAIE